MFNFIFDQGLHFVDKSVVLQCDINRMEKVIDLYVHHGGNWMLEPRLSYVVEKVLILEDFEIDHLDIASIHNVYKEQLNYENVEQLYVMEPGLSITESLYLVEDSDGIMKILSKRDGDTNIFEFFANHDIDAPIYAPNIHLVENQDINAL